MANKPSEDREDGYEPGIKGKFSEFKNEKPKMFKIAIVVVAVLVLGIGVRVVNGGGGGSDVDPTAVETSEIIPLDTGEDDDISLGAGTDTMLLQSQADLNSEYGIPKEGFIWDQQGNLLSRGIAGMSSENAMYTYLRAVSTMDLGTVQRVSRESKVYQQISDWNDSKTSANSDYSEDYKKRVYQAAMKSIQVDGTEDATVFAETRRSYTVKAKMLDVTDKDFWQKDKDAIFEELYKFDEAQSDSTKSEQYLQNYILNYYTEGTPKLRPVTFSLTVEKFADINSGWLVSIDDELNSSLLYQDGKTIDSYIMEQYQYYKTDRIANAKGGE